MARQRSSVSSYVNILINPVTGRPTNLVYIIVGVILIWIVYVNHYRGEDPDVANPKLSKHAEDINGGVNGGVRDQNADAGGKDTKRGKFNPDLIPFQHLLNPQDGQDIHLPPGRGKNRKESDVPPERLNIPHPMPKDFPIAILHQPRMNPMNCPVTTYILIVVATLPAEVKLRNAIRRTWGNPENFDELKIAGLTWKVVFAVGNGEAEDNKRILDESKSYGDVLQGEFRDTGVEDTRKTMMAFKWVAEDLLSIQGCRPAFVLKAPAKVYIHIPYVLDWIARTVKDLQNVYRGKILRRDTPIRVKEDPLYVPPEDYAKDTFPDIIRNPVYLLSTDVVEQMVKRFTEITPIAMEDSYLGLLANDMGIKPAHDEHFLLMQRPRNICHYKNMMFVYDVAPAEQVHVFNVVEKGHLAEQCREDRGLKRR